MAAAMITLGAPQRRGGIASGGVALTLSRFDINPRHARHTRGARSG